MRLPGPRKGLVTRACRKQCILHGQLILHPHSGTPVTAKTFPELLVELDILSNYSRHCVSHNNPCSESQFKTLKYAPSFPTGFADLQHARSYCEVFFSWYNAQHRNNRLGLLTPVTIHCRVTYHIQSALQYTVDHAYQRYPERLVNGKPRPLRIPDRVWIN